MTFDIKDLIYFCVYAISIGAVITTLRMSIARFNEKTEDLKRSISSKTESLERAIEDRKQIFNKIIFAESGGLNFPRIEDCKIKHEQNERVIADIYKYLRRTDRNIAIIMLRLKVKPRRVIREADVKEE